VHIVFLLWPLVAPAGVRPAAVTCAGWRGSARGLDGRAAGFFDVD
jgi:hypothetical protein